MNYGDLPLTQLARRCFESSGNDVWDELVRRLQPKFQHVAYGVAVQWGYANVRDIEDVVQNVWETVLERRAGFSRLPEDNEDAAYAYFKVLAANSAHDHFRAKYAKKRDEAKTEEIEPRLEDLASELGKKQIETHILIAQVEAALIAIASKRDTSLFWMYYRQGFTAKEIAALTQNELSDKGVESLIYRLTRELRKKFNSDEGEFGGKPS